MSFPPPYRSYSFEEADSNNNHSNSNNNSDPYMSPPVSPRSTTAGSPYAQLPAFDSPPRYSQRLRGLVESRGHPMQLNLDRPQSQHPASTVVVPQPMVVVEKPSEQEQEQLAVDYDEKEDYEPEQVNLLTSTDLEEGVDFDDVYDFDGGRRCHGRSQSGGFMGWSWSGSGTRRSSCRSHNHRRSSRVAKWQRRSSHDDRELSWLTFIGIAMFVFLLMTVCGVFVAWSAGGSIGASELAASGNRSYWVGSNTNAASGAVVKVTTTTNSKQQQVPNGGEIDIQQLGGHFVIDSYTVEVVEETKGKEKKKPKIRL